MKAGKGYLILLTAVFLCAAAVWMSRDAVETVSEKNETESAEELAPRVAISFDDGPHKTYTPLLLDGLKERDVKATFFLIGENISGKEEIVRRMAEEGHLIGNHTERRDRPDHRRRGKSGAREKVRHHAGADPGNRRRRTDEEIRQRLQHQEICGYSERSCPILNKKRINRLRQVCRRLILFFCKTRKGPFFSEWSLSLVLFSIFCAYE